MDVSSITDRELVAGILVIIIILIYVPYVPIGFWVLPPTGSMYPAMGGCDIVLYAPGEPEVGAVMMYWEAPHSLLIHRIIGRNGTGYVFQGDNLPEPDGTVQPDQIHAKIYAVFDTPVPRDACITVFEPLYNSFYALTLTDRTFAPVPTE